VSAHVNKTASPAAISTSLHVEHEVVAVDLSRGAPNMKRGASDGGQHETRQSPQRRFELRGGIRQRFDFVLDHDAPVELTEHLGPILFRQIVQGKPGRREPIRSGRHKASLSGHQLVDACSLDDVLLQYNRDSSFMLTMPPVRLL
jgi:hypothetical protein